MKKTLLFLITFALIALIGAVAFAAATDETEWFTVTFNVEFTTPVEIPEEYGGVLFNSMTFAEDFPKGSVVHSEHLSIMCMGDAIFEGWDKDLDTYMIQEDTTFTATINNDGCIPVYFKTIDESGNPVGTMQAVSITEPGIYKGNFSHLISFVKKGDKLEETDTPVVMTVSYEGYVLDAEASSFSPEPVGYEVNEPVEFICEMKKVKPEEAHKYTVTFKAEFTTPMELPDGYSVLEWDSTELWPNDILYDNRIPSPRFLGDDMKFLGWDKEPNQTVVTGDMTFTAKFDNDGCVPVFFKSVDEDGKAIDALLVPGSFVLNQAVAVVKAGDKLTEKTVPPIGISWQYPEYSSWDTTPIGYTANEPHEFTFTYKYYYSVKFVAEPAKLEEEQIIHRGEAAKAPDVPKADGYLFTGWDKDFSKVSENMVVTAIMYKYGDANMDNVINTADAVSILKHCADMQILTDNALLLSDVNADKAVNTADAVAVLKISAGMN